MVLETKVTCFVLGTKLGTKLSEVRKNTTCPWPRTDRKTQVTVYNRTDGGAMVPRVYTVLTSTQFDETIANEQIAEDLEDHVIKPMIPPQNLDDKTTFRCESSGHFVISGPHGDEGLKGREIIIVTCGGRCAHGGGAFWGNEPAKVDCRATTPFAACPTM